MKGEAWPEAVMPFTVRTLKISSLTKKNGFIKNNWMLKRISVIVNDAKAGFVPKTREGA